jgi:hypothetical protein
MNYGLRRVDVIELNSSDTPAAVSTTAYEGMQVKGSTAYEVTMPDPRKITGLGEDGITTVVFLPPQEGASAVLRTDSADPNLAAVLDGTKVAALGEMTMIGMATDRQGFEPRVALIMYQAARGLTTGRTYWHTYISPSAQVVRKSGGMIGDKVPTIYNVAPNRVSKHLWGPAFTMATEGYLSTQFIEIWSNYPIRIASFVADGTAVDFTFPVNFPAVSTAGIKVYVNDVEVTTGITKATTKVTFAVAPTATNRVDIIREVAG